MTSSSGQRRKVQAQARLQATELAQAVEARDLGVVAAVAVDAVAQQRQGVALALGRCQTPYLLATLIIISGCLKELAGTIAG